MTWVLLVVATLAVLAAILWGYNSLVRYRVRLHEAWAQIDVQLKRRHDLIPNLVEVVQGYAAHERNTFQSVTTARTAAIRAQATGDPGQVQAAEAELKSSVDSLLVVAEQYPQLRAADGFLRLQEELTATEDRIAYARHFYNTSVRDYNIAVATIPRSWLAAALAYRSAGYFEIEADQRGPVPIASADPVPTTDQPA